MSADGNHGGASDEETGAALFLYSKAPLVATAGGDAASDDKELHEYAQRILDSSREVPQVDLVPTLALLSGLPIPFGNLGSVIPSLFFVPPTAQTSPGGNESSAVAAFESLNRALRLNRDQVRRYLFRYSSESKLPERAYDHLEKLFVDIQNVEKRLEQVRSSDNGESGSAYAKADIPLLLRLHEDLASQQQNYLREALSLGRSIWTQFDLCSMGWGMLVLTWSFLVGMALVKKTANGRSWSESRRALGTTAAVGILFFICPASIHLPLLPAAPLSRALVTASCTGLTEMTWRLLVPSKAGALANGESSRIIRTRLCPNSAVLVATVTVLLHALALLSNSYIVAEGSVMQFLSATTGLLLLARAQHLGNKRNTATLAALMFLFATRVGSALEPPNIIKTTTTVERTLAPLGAIAMLAVGSSMKAAEFAGHPLSTLGRFTVALSVVGNGVCAIFWVASPIEATFWRLWLPRSVYLSLLVTLVCFLVRELRSATRYQNLQSTSDHLLIIWQLIPSFMLVLGPTSPLSVLCLVVQCLSFAFVVTCHRSNAPAVFGGTTPWILLWASCSYQAFFTTGHANTFSSLQNAAGFVGFDIFNFYAAGALLGLNTFGCFALGVLALPWLVLRSRQSEFFWTTRVPLTFSAYFSLNALVSTLFVALQRRHLMVWAIFAPKFIFDGVVLLVTEALLLLLFVPLSSHRDKTPTTHID
ncbi:unnamed protein product [Phytophthora fragariaefolia]|nr:unnamed protein product [Phytophthora fragariaefolia]